MLAPANPLNVQFRPVQDLPVLGGVHNGEADPDFDVVVNDVPLLAVRFGIRWSWRWDTAIQPDELFGLIGALAAPDDQKVLYEYERYEWFSPGPKQRRVHGWKHHEYKVSPNVFARTSPEDVSDQKPTIYGGFTIEGEEHDWRFVPEPLVEATDDDSPPVWAIQVLCGYRKEHFVNLREVAFAYDLLAKTAADPLLTSEAGLPILETVMQDTLGICEERRPPELSEDAYSGPTVSMRL